MSDKDLQNPCPSLPGDVKTTGSAPTVYLRQSSEFGPWLETGKDDPSAVAFVAAPASPAASVPFLGESDVSALMTFHSQMEDHEADGYTVHKETMKRLAKLGVVNS